MKINYFFIILIILFLQKLTFSKSISSLICYFPNEIFLVVDFDSVKNFIYTRGVNDSSRCDASSLMDTRMFIYIFSLTNI